MESTFTPQPDQIQRKTASEKLLSSYQIPYHPILYSEAESEVEIRSKDEILVRILALAAVGLKSEGLEDEFLIPFIDKYELTPHFSPGEATFLQQANPEEQVLHAMNWRYESMETLMWVVGLIDSLDFPNKLCDASKLVHLLYQKSYVELLQIATLRPKAEIMDALDLSLLFHWAARNSWLKQEDPPAGIEHGVVYERHYAFNWVTQLEREEWDEVSTGT